MNNEIKELNFPPNFEGLVLGCIDAGFCKYILDTRWKAFDEIYKIYMLLHRSDLNISENFRQTFSHFFFLFFFRAQAVEEALRKDRDCPVEKETPKRRGASGRKEAQPPPPDVESWSSSQC